jgi:DNA-binding HxlR family transcriptional regulator
VALEAFGDAWSLLVVRDLMFKGRKTFNEFLNAEEGIASNILADRLQRLEANGIVVKRRDPVDARRIVYRLTDKGIALAPVLLELVVWSARHERTDAPSPVVKEMEFNRERCVARIRRDWRRSGRS